MDWKAFLKTITVSAAGAAISAVAPMIAAMLWQHFGISVNPGHAAEIGGGAAAGAALFLKSPTKG